MAGNLTREDVDVDELTRLMAGGDELARLTDALRAARSPATADAPGRWVAGAVRVSVLKMLTPPGPTSSPTMISTMPQSS